jgi:branched-chain amino acid aminotransferase
VSPRAKTHNYLNLVLGDLEAKAHDPGAWSLLLDDRGNLAEGTGSNIFLVKNGILKTPCGHNVLPGVSRATVIELAARLGIEFQETDLDPFDAATADEIFITSTSLCLCPVSSFNRRKVGNGAIPGPVTTRLTHAYVELIGFDFVAQYRAHLT